MGTSASRVMQSERPPALLGPKVLKPEAGKRMRPEAPGRPLGGL